MRVIVCVTLLLCLVVLSWSKISPDHTSLEVMESGSVPFLVHVPSFAPNIVVMVTVTSGENPQWYVHTSHLDTMKHYSTVQINHLQAPTKNKIPQINDIHQHQVIVISFSNNYVYQYQLHPNTGDLTHGQVHHFPNAAISFGTDAYNPNHDAVVFFSNHTLYTYSVSSNLVPVVHPLTTLALTLDSVITGISALSKDFVVIQNDSDLDNVFLFVNTKTGHITQHALPLPPSYWQRFTQTKGTRSLKGYQVSTKLTAQRTFHITPTDLQHSKPLGKRTDIGTGAKLRNNVAVSKSLFMVTNMVNGRMRLNQVLVNETAVIQHTYVDDKFSASTVIDATPHYLLVFCLVSSHPTLQRWSFSEDF
eukprot:TRINITY_DN12740_c0_g1_i1.p1 TRINITY_DN12740_c0_g1~~TRINITY_DN12740_c0_g1_i1.p1  ORF type:complete len:381 (+),score=39.40 TRINITY_DN12740_c0_g1_i1:58-1143(+)